MYYAYDICMVKWEFHFSLIMTVAYTGNLTSFMTNPGFEEPLDTPAKLLEKGVKLGMYNYQGSTTLAFGGSSNPEYCQIWSAKEWITSFGDSLKGTISGKTSYRGINKIVINLYPAMLILSMKSRSSDHSACILKRGFGFLFHPGDMVFMDYRWYLESQMSTTYIDALGRPKMILANYDMFRFGIGWSVQPRSMFLESFNQGRCSIFKVTANITKRITMTKSNSEDYINLLIYVFQNINFVSLTHIESDPRVSSRRA